MSLTDTIDAWGRPRILVIGDLMLDRYTFGSARRTSQEAPVLVLQADNREHRPGGASNVALMLGTLEAEVSCVGVVGQDDAGRTLTELLRSADIETSGIVSCDRRPTTLKERFVGRSGSGLPSQILRVDTETTDPIDVATESRLIAALKQQIPRQNAVLISDYDKGVCTTECLQFAIDCAREHGIPVLVDPGRGRDVELYRNATLIKPNRTETEEATGLPIRDGSDAVDAGKQLCQRLNLAMAVITLDADGIALVQSHGEGKQFPTKARSVYDITGAGDMVLAVLGLAIAAGTTPHDAVQLANAAAGLEVDRTGVTPLTRDEIRRETQSHHVSSRQKVVHRAQLDRLADEYRLRGKRMVLTNGCFDLLHVGHATYLEQAAAEGDVLIVAINSDESVGRLKGADRPVIREAERAAMLAALGCVDHVVVFTEDTPHELIRVIRPDVLVKGGTYQCHEVVGRELVEAYGGQVRVVGLVDGVSTTQIVHSVQNGRTLRRAG